LGAAGEIREIHFDVFAVVTGVPRGEECDTLESTSVPDSHTNKWERYKTFSEPPTLGLVEEPVPSGASHLVPPQSETYISVTIRAPKDGDPGQIEEGRFAVENGAVVLSDYRGIRIASLPLQPGQDPTAVRGTCCGRPGNKRQTFITRCAIPI
jgi:hypothetical protein